MGSNAPEDAGGGGGTMLASLVDWTVVEVEVEAVLSCLLSKSRLLDEMRVEAETMAYGPLWKRTNSRWLSQ